MAKRSKKGDVKPEQRKEWLRRIEQDGEYPPQIAKTSGYDVRTVRKQIDLAREERERREARLMVLRDALSEHYRDLCLFSERLNSAISFPPVQPSITLKEDRMWEALKEHLPRSPIWKSVQKWDELVVSHNRLVEQIKGRCKLEARKMGYEFTSFHGEQGLSEGFTKFIADNIISIAKDNMSLKDVANLTYTPLMDAELCRAEKGEYTIGHFLIKNAKHIDGHVYPEKDDFKNYIDNLCNDSTNWQESQELQKIVIDLERTSTSLHDELAIHILRRVIPGRCKYCPI